MSDELKPGEPTLEELAADVDVAVEDNEIEDGLVDWYMTLTLKGEAVKWEFCFNELTAAHARRYQTLFGEIAEDLWSRLVDSRNSMDDIERFVAIAKIQSGHVGPIEELGLKRRDVVSLIVDKRVAPPF